MQTTETREMRNISRARLNIANEVWAWVREHRDSLDSERGVRKILDGFDYEDNRLAERTAKLAGEVASLKKEQAKLRSESKVARAVLKSLATDAWIAGAHQTE